MKTGGLPNAIAKKVPNITLNPPAYGPKIIPKRGAIMSERAKDPDTPMTGKVGIKRKTM